MATGVVTPIVPLANDVKLGEGVIYINYGTDNIVLGATEGGSKFKIEKKIIDVKYDGAYGPTKGLKRVEIFIPRLIVNCLKLNYNTLGYGIPITVTNMTTYQRIVFDLNIESTDVLTNVAFIGQAFDGKALKIIVSNCLMDGDIELSFKEKASVVGELQYTGHYTYAAPTTPPFEIKDYDV
jgi:hypothetical protein